MPRRIKSLATTIGVNKANRLFGESDLVNTDEKWRDVNTAFAKMELWRDVNLKKEEEARKESYSAINMSNRRKSPKSLNDELFEYQGYIDKRKGKDKVLDNISNALTVASFVPGIDTFTNLAQAIVDFKRGDYVSAGLSAFGSIPVVGEIADVAKTADKVVDIAKAVDKTTDVVKTLDKAVDTAKAVDKASDVAKATKRKEIINDILESRRVNKANKLDSHHAFPDIVDNYAGKSEKFPLTGGDGKERKLYQIKGSLNGKKGIFEWILEQNKGVTHRRFVENGKITGKPNSR